LDGSEADAKTVTDPEVTEPVPVPQGPPSRTRVGRHARWSGSSRWKPLLTSNLFLGVVLAVLAWPTSTGRLIVASGIGSSWRAAITMAAHDHLAFGSRVVFTFGPLGFLVSPQLFFISNTILAFLFTLGFLTAVFGALTWALRHTLSVLTAAVVAYVVGGMSLVSARYFGTNVAVEDVLALVLIVCVSVLGRRRADPPPRWVWMGLGGALGIFSLVKLSLGIGIGVTLLITVVCLPSGRWRALGSVALGAVPLFCLGWFGTGNGFGNLFAFARSSIDVIGGYGAAMSLEDPTRTYSYWLAAGAVVLIGAFAVVHTRGMERRARIGVGLITFTTLWFLFKEGFVRHDAHDLVFFVAAPLVLAAFASSWRSPAWLVTAMLGLTIVTASVSGNVPALVTQPVQATKNFLGEAATMVSSHKQSAVIAQSRQELDDHFQLPTKMVRLMRGHTVDVSPWQQTAIWAHPGIRFDPLPVLQDYSAFTPSLDQLDITFLASSNAPRYILRQPLAEIDGRNPSFEPPGTQLAIECRYHQVAADSVWQLLERQPDRCGRSQLLDKVTTGVGHWVAVPSAPVGDDIVASFGLSSGVGWAVESLAFKPPSVYLEANNGLVKWRFIAATGPEFHVLRASADLGYSSTFVPVHARNLRFSIDGEGPSPFGITISFYAIPVGLAPGSSGAQQ